MHDIREFLDPPKPTRPVCWVPTPDEIREACLRIQAKWTPEDERSRRVVKNVGWEVPGVRADPS